jgi:hypothetical protein
MENADTVIYTSTQAMYVRTFTSLLKRLIAGFVPWLLSMMIS